VVVNFWQPLQPGDAEASTSGQEARSMHHAPSLWGSPRGMLRGAIVLASIGGGGLYGGSTGGGSGGGGGPGGCGPAGPHATSILSDMPGNEVTEMVEEVLLLDVGGE
jgi:hypothetical protein